jgi:methyl-accepting chemotaxis protein
LVFAYCVPIKNEQNEIIGTLTAIKAAVEMSNYVSSISYGGENGSAFMLNKDGTTIAHKNFSLVENGDNDFQKSDSSLTALVELERKMVNGERGIGTYTYEENNKEISKYMAYAPVEGTNWSLALRHLKLMFMKGVKTFSKINCHCYCCFLCLRVFP